MKKQLIHILATAALIITACDNTSTTTLLNGDFLPADMSVPNILAPADGAAVIDADLVTDEVEVLLSWTGKSGAESYTVEVFSDDALTAHIPGSPFTVPAPETSVSIEVPSAGTYFWRVRASVTAAGLYSDYRCFKALEDCLYVHFPYDPADPDAKPDDTGKTGNIDSPYQTINRAMAEAYKLGISTVKVASRGEISAGNFAAYEEYFSFKDGVSLQGGWSSDFTVRHDFSAGIDDNDYETKLAGKYYQPMKIEDIYTATLIEGFVLNPYLDGVAYNTGGFIIENCGRDLIIRYCKIYSEGLGMQCASLLVKYSAAQIICNRISSSESSSYTLFGVVNYYSDSTLSGNEIIANSVSVTGELSCLSCGVQYSGDGVLINNLIVAGNASGGIGMSTSESFGLNINSGNPLVINNTIVGGNATTVSATACSYGLCNESDCFPLIINNIIMTNDLAGDSFGIYGSGVNGSGTDDDDDNYYYNCLYSNNGINYTGITADVTNVTVEPSLDSDYMFTASSPSTVTGGGVIDPFTLAGITPLDEYLLDIAGVTRTPTYVEGSALTGWSMGAYEY